MNLQPLCFVIMPYGVKLNPTGGVPIDFDRIYASALAPAIVDADMEPIRADEERTGGIIHKPMFERLLLCDFAVADLTTASANVFYELGIRHAARPATTVSIFAQHQPIPFDVSFLRSLPYSLGDNNQFGQSEALALRGALAERLKSLRNLAAKQAPVDSPLFTLLSDWKPGDIARLKTDVFRERVQLNEQLKRRLAAIRDRGLFREGRDDAHRDLESLRAELGALDAVEAGTVIDLMLSYRALEDWDGMISICDSMSETLKRQVLVREQVAFAYNRRGGRSGDPSDQENALRILEEIEAQQGPSSETCGLRGRIHKDRWQEASEGNDQVGAAGHLRKAIDAYLRGFMADQRDAYPGINAATLLDIKGDEESLELRTKLLPVVHFAVERRLTGKEPDYWDHATMLELAVLKDEPDAAMGHLQDAVAAIRESWEPRTTVNNLTLIEAARMQRGAETTWLNQIIEELRRRAD